MPSARIFKPARTAMQSGRAKTKDWVLEFEPRVAKRADPLMGWAGSSDTLDQVTLFFDKREEAVAYATRHGIEFTHRDAARDQAEAQSLRRQFPLRPRALTCLPCRRDAPLAQLDRARAF